MLHPGGDMDGMKGIVTMKQSILLLLYFLKTIKDLKPRSLAISMPVSAGHQNPSMPSTLKHTALVMSETPQMTSMPRLFLQKNPP